MKKDEDKKGTLNHSPLEGTLTIHDIKVDLETITHVFIRWLAPLFFHGVSSLF